jgi:NAD(P)H-nitrite reductase large subunit
MMTDTQADKKKDVVCYCSGTTKASVMMLIENGIDDLDRISRETGACSGCGACDATILELIRVYG